LRGSRIQQLLVTRFSVRIGEATGPQPRSWIEERLALFERFTVPSLRAQQMADFTWWLLCDVQTDPDIADHLRALDPRIRLAMIGPRKEHDAVRARADDVITSWQAARAMRAGTEILIQTRLDSDDALHPLYLQDLVDELPIFLASESRDWLRVAASGFQYDIESRKLFRREFPRGPFQSYYQLVLPDRPASSIPAHHGRATLEVIGMASYHRQSWIQVVHGGNLRNSIVSRDLVRDSGSIARQFQIEL
jgi:hypothetical protein